MSTGSEQNQNPVSGSSYSIESIGSKNVKCFVIKKYQNKFLLWEIELHRKQLSWTVQKQPSGAIRFQKVLQKTPILESFLCSNYRLTVQSSNNITKMTLARIFRNLSKCLNIIDCKYSRKFILNRKDDILSMLNIFILANLSWN